MLISWGNVCLTDRWSLIKRLIGGDLGRRHELWPETNILNIWHSPMFYYCTVLLVHTFSYFMWCFIIMLETIIMMFKITWRNWHRLRRVRMLHFTRHFKDTIQERLTILISFCSKFIGVHVYQKLSKQSLIWPNYCKNRMVQFFGLTVYKCTWVNEWCYSVQPVTNSTVHGGSFHSTKWLEMIKFS